MSNNMKFYVFRLFDTISTDSSLSCMTSRYVHAYIHTYIHAYIHTCMHAYIHTYKHTYIHTYIHTYMHTYIHTYIHTYVHTYIHAYIHTSHQPSSQLCERFASSCPFVKGEDVLFRDLFSSLFQVWLHFYPRVFLLVFLHPLASHALILLVDYVCSLWSCLCTGTGLCIAAQKDEWRNTGLWRHPQLSTFSSGACDLFVWGVSRT